MSITTIIQYIYKHTLQYGWTLLFRYERFINFLLRFMATRGERHNSYNVDPSPQRAVHLVMFKISVGRDPKIPTTSFNGQNPTAEYTTLALMVQSQLTFFQNPQILGTISSGNDVIDTPASFPVWGFIMTMAIVISFVREGILHHMTMQLGS